MRKIICIEAGDICKMNIKQLIFLSEIKEHINDFDYLYEYLVKCKNDGMDKESMLKNLEILRSESDSKADEDMLLDLMDLASGWCSPHMSIYKGED